MLEHLRNVIRRKGDDGATAVEYGLMVAAIAALIVLIVFALGGVVKNAFDDTCDTIAGKGVAAEANCAAG